MYKVENINFKYAWIGSLYSPHKPKKLNTSMSLAAMEPDQIDLLEALSSCSISNQLSMLDAVASKVREKFARDKI